MSHASSERRRLSRDERDAVERLVLEFGPRLAAYVRHSFPAGVDVDEVCADVFYRISQHVERVRLAERPELYLLRVARNVCIEQLARNRRMAFNAPREDPRAARGDEPDRCAERSESEQMLMDEVRRMPTAQREVVVLRMSSGLQFDEIAELLNIPLGTALSRMHAALEHLRHVLRACDEPAKR